MLLRSRSKLSGNITAGLSAMLLATAAGVVACAPVPTPQPALKVEPVPFSSLQDWPADRQAEALAAFVRSCDRWRRQADFQPIGDALPGTAGSWKAACGEAVKIPARNDQAARRFFETRFQPYLASDQGRPEGLFTGYYEAELHGSRKPDKRYRVPLLRRPDHHVTVDLGRFRNDWKGETLTGRIVDGRVVPAETRAEIENGALAGRKLELLWVDDPVDAFFLHIQGSGRVLLDDGQVVRIGYAGKNGHAYVPIGRVLAEEGAIARDEVSMQTIRSWLAAHPERMNEILSRNPSYVFFRVLEGDGPVGAAGAALTPERSLAVDPAFIPLGVPLWLETSDPLDSAQPLRRLVVAQDIGGAIKGPVRGDLFWGYGREATERAGRMKQPGRYFLLLPKASGTSP